MKKILVILAAVLLTMGIISAAPSEAIATTMGLWLFDEGEGYTAFDSSGNANDGTLMGGVAWSPDTPFSYAGNHSLEFTGGYVQVEDSATLDITGAITLEAWIKPNSLGNWDNFIFKGDNNTGSGQTANYQFAMGFSGDQLAFDFYNAGWHTHVVSGVLSTEEWMHLAVTYDGSSVKFYKDGSLLATQAETAALIANNYYLGIGAVGSGIDSYYGFIDEVRISNVALSREELGYSETLAPVPEPATMLLLGSGLVGLAGFGRKKLFKKA